MRVEHTKVKISHLQEVFREMLEDWVQSVVVEVTVFCMSVMVEVNEVFNVVMRTYVLNVLFHTLICLHQPSYILINSTTTSVVTFCLDLNFKN